MLLHLKQMTGRLIRTEEDRGIVVSVEGRTDRRYFAKLTDALPVGVDVRVVPAGDCGEKLLKIVEEVRLGDSGLT